MQPHHLTAHRVTRISPARAPGEHLQAANDPGCGRCRLHNNREGRACACSLEASQRAARAAVLWLLMPMALAALLAYLFGWLRG